MYCGCIMYLQNVYVQRFIPNASSVTAPRVCVCTHMYTHTHTVNETRLCISMQIFLFCEIINGLI